MHMHMHTGDRQSPIKYVHRLDIMAYTNHRFLKKNGVQSALPASTKCRSKGKRAFEAAFCILCASGLHPLCLTSSHVDAGTVG